MRSIRVNDLAGLCDANIVDVRESHEHLSSHWPDALSMRLTVCPQETPPLDAKGRDAVTVLGDTQAWISSGYPVEKP